MLRNHALRLRTSKDYVLNEVLSLNAQESHHGVKGQKWGVLLNEVLSLNAQELPGERAYADCRQSSMKS